MKKTRFWPDIQEGEGCRVLTAAAVFERALS
jgi:hypothetical protein